MRKEDGNARPRPRPRPGRPLLTAATTTGMVSLMTGCTSGNLVPPPPIEVCFEPTTAWVETSESDGSFRQHVPLDERGCGLVAADYYFELRATAEGYCTLTTRVDELHDGSRLTLSPEPCPLPDLGVPDQGVSTDQGTLDAAPDAESEDARVTDGG